MAGNHGGRGFILFGPIGVVLECRSDSKFVLELERS